MRSGAAVCLFLLWLGAVVPGEAAGGGEPTILKALLDAEAWGTALLQSSMPQTRSALEGVEGVLDSLSSIADSVRGIYCTEPTVKRGKKVPSMLYGPQLNITIAAGNCTLSKEGSLMDRTNKTVTCFGPSISYAQAPITFVAKHHTPDTFDNGGCVLSKTVGKQQGVEERVLYSGGPSIKFETMAHFQEALRAGTLALWGIDAQAQGQEAAATRTSASASTAAQATAAPAAASRWQQQWQAGTAPAAAAAEKPQPAQQPGSFEAMLQQAGWQVIMRSSSPATATAPAPAPAPQMAA